MVVKLYTCVIAHMIEHNSVLNLIAPQFSDIVSLKNIPLLLT